eukprot:TRINITY_DN320_c0_g1_i1.p1 TRINITY_DN320_c0_g1~~TRINITY_DN320_c0_g1_i1.p1  ORF type:complete len:254 (+),score=43.22 TRINITY_DN320_c0_g1_i1:78-839(+)
MMSEEALKLEQEQEQPAEEQEATPEQTEVDIEGGAVEGENPFLGPSDQELAFVNISSTGAGDNATGEEPAAAIGEKVGMWARVVTGCASAKTFKESMTADLAPWSSFSDRKKFSVPSKTQIFGRVKNNLRIYHANYMMLLGALAIWTAISNLTFVLAMFSSVGLYYYYRMQTHDNATFVVNGREIHPTQFYLFLTGSTLFLFWLTGGGSTMFWMVASAAIVVFGHASFRESEENEESISPEQAMQALQALRGA